MTEAEETKMATFMYLFWAPKHLLSGPPRSPEAARESGEKWHAWQEVLRAAGHAPGGGQLEAEGRCVTAAGVAPGPFGDDHVMGGYFLVEASSLEEATELAKGCPLVGNGGTVEVRPVMSA